MTDEPFSVEAELRLRRAPDAVQPPPIYTNYVQANFTPEDFTLHLGWYTVPALLGPPEGGLDVDIEPVARVVIPLNLVRGMIAVMQRQLAAYESSFGPIPDHPNKPAWLREQEAEK